VEFIGIFLWSWVFVSAKYIVFLYLASLETGISRRADSNLTAKAKIGCAYSWQFLNVFN